MIWCQSMNRPVHEIVAYTFVPVRRLQLTLLLYSSLYSIHQSKHCLFTNLTTAFITNKVKISPFLSHMAALIYLRQTLTRPWIVRGMVCLFTPQLSPPRTFPTTDRHGQAELTRPTTEAWPG